MFRLMRLPNPQPLSTGDADNALKTSVGAVGGDSLRDGLSTTLSHKGGHSQQLSSISTQIFLPRKTYVPRIHVNARTALLDMAVVWAFRPRLA